MDHDAVRPGQRGGLRHGGRGERRIANAGHDDRAAGRLGDSRFDQHPAFVDGQRVKLAGVAIDGDDADAVRDQAADQPAKSRQV
jgi:hypothetical protein